MSLHNSQQDALLTSTVAFPAAGASGTAPATGGFDLGLNRKTWKEEIRVDVPALSGFTDNTKTLAFTIKDSADNSTFTAVAALGTQSVAGVAATGSAATSLWWPVPRDCQRYIQVTCAETAAGANVTTSNFSAYVLPV